MGGGVTGIEIRNRAESIGVLEDVLRRRGELGRAGRGWGERFGDAFCAVM